MTRIEIETKQVNDAILSLKEILGDLVNIGFTESNFNTESKDMEEKEKTLIELKKRKSELERKVIGFKREINGTFLT